MFVLVPQLVQMMKMVPVSLSLLLGWTEGEVLCHCFTESQLERVSVFHFVCTDLVPSPAGKTQSRRQSFGGPQESFSSGPLEHKGKWFHRALAED